MAKIELVMGLDRLTVKWTSDNDSGRTTDIVAHAVAEAAGKALGFVWRSSSLAKDSAITYERPR